jgi:hypothetical protein
MYTQLWPSGSSHCEVLQADKTISEEYTASIFITEMSKVGKVVCCVEVRRLEISPAQQGYLSHIWTENDLTAMVWKQADIYILTICALERKLAQAIMFLTCI